MGFAPAAAGGTLYRMTSRPADSTKGAAAGGPRQADDGDADVARPAPGDNSLAADPTSALRTSLAELCSRAGAEGAAVLALDADSRVAVTALWPEADAPGESEPPDWLTAALRAAPGAAGADGEPGSDAGAAMAVDLHDPGALYGEPPRRRLVLVPLPGAANGDEELGDSVRDVGLSDRAVAALWAFLHGSWGLLEAVGGKTPAQNLLAVCLPLPAEKNSDSHLFSGENHGGGASLGQANAKIGDCHHFSSAPAGALAPAIALTSAVNEHERFLAAAMALCNELSALTACERVSLGVPAGHYVRLAAMSHTERFSRKTQMVQLIEAAMEECLDQDIEIAAPAPADAQYVCRCCVELCERGTPRLAVLCLPLRRGDRCVGAICLERRGDAPFEAGEVESLRLACDLLTPRLMDLRRRDRWIGAKAADGLRAGAAAVVGPRHTWAKLLLLLVAAGVLYASLARGEYRIDAAVEFQASTKQVAVAPFEGEIDAVDVELGDQVKAGQLLATLRTLPLRRKLDQARAGLFEHLKQADSARSDKKWAEAQMAAAQARQFQEQIALLTEQIEQASVRARIDGTVVRGDLERFVGSTVEKGQVLFEIAPLGELRAEVLVPEDQIADLLDAMKRGEVRATLAAGAYPDRPIEAVIERVLPLAEKVDGEVVFRARARLVAPADDANAANPAGAGGLRWLRPSMAGAAHVPLGRHRLAWIWSRRIVNKIRLWLWM